MLSLVSSAWQHGELFNWEFLSLENVTAVKCKVSEIIAKRVHSFT